VRRGGAGQYRGDGMPRPLSCVTARVAHVCAPPAQPPRDGLKPSPTPDTAGHPPRHSPLVTRSLRPAVGPLATRYSLLVTLHLPLATPASRRCTPASRRCTPPCGRPTRHSPLAHSGLRYANSLLATRHPSLATRHSSLVTPASRRCTPPCGRPTRHSPLATRHPGVSPVHSALRPANSQPCRFAAADGETPIRASAEGVAYRRQKYINC
jgi:hypothetical protein